MLKEIERAIVCDVLVARAEAIEAAIPADPELAALFTKRQREADLLREVALAIWEGKFTG